MKKIVSTPVYSITPFSLLDYQDITSCIVWFAGCNMRCPYCYNPEIVLGKGKYSYDYVLNFLKTRRGLLDGVVLSGGECTSHRSIISFAQSIKAMGFKIKVDTNGSNPRVIRQMILNNLIDFVALDMKAPIAKYQSVSRLDSSTEFIESFNIIKDSGIMFEVRTTYHSSLLNSEDIENMLNFLKENQYQGTFYIQNFLKDSECLERMPDSSSLKSFHSVSNIPIVIRN